MNKRRDAEFLLVECGMRVQSEKFSAGRKMIDRAKAPKPLDMGIPPGSKIALAIIYALRSRNPNPVPFSDVRKLASEVLNVYHPSISFQFERTLAELIDVGLVEIFNAEGQRLDYIIEIAEETAIKRALRDGSASFALSPIGATKSLACCA